MVSIIERNSYLSELRGNSKLELFFSLIFSNPPKSDFETTAEVDEVYKNVVFSIVENDENKFVKWYGKISARQPNEYSPFTNDDLLLFVLLIGTLKFNQTSDWIKNTLEIRKNTNSEKNLISRTFKNIINDNFQSTDNAFQIVLIIEELTGKKLLTWTEKKHLYLQLVTSNFPLYKSELLNITSLKSFDSIILEGDKSDESDYSMLKEFEKLFNLRVALISKFFHWVIVGGLYLFIVYSYFVNQTFQDFIKHNSGFFNLIGTGGLVGMFAFSKRLTNFNERIIKRFWGYKKDKK